MTLRVVGKIAYRRRRFISSINLIIILFDVLSLVLLQNMKIVTSFVPSIPSTKNDIISTLQNIHGVTKNIRKLHPLVSIKAKVNNDVNDNIDNEMIQRAYKNLIDDLSNMKSSRISKFITTNDQHTSNVQSQPKRISSSIKKKQLLQTLSNHAKFCTLYCHDNNDYDYYYFTNMTKVVGPMYRRQIEKMIHQHPKLITDMLSNLKVSGMTSLRSVQDQILSDLQLSKSNQKQLILAYEKKSKSFAKLNRNNIRSIFQTFRLIGMEDEAICNMMIKAPQLFSYTNININKSISYLKGMGLSKEEISKMVGIRPMVLAHCNKEGEKMDLIVKFFQDDLGLDYKNIVVRYPQVFELKAHRLKEKAEFLMDAFKLHRCNDLSSMISTFPPLLWMAHPSIETKVAFLSNEFELRDDELRDMLVTYPQVLGLSISKNLQLKVDFLTGTDVSMSRQRLKEMILYQPALLAYSLEGRIKPRILMLKESYISFSYAPPYLMSLSDDKFSQWLDLQKSTWTIN